MYSEIKHVGEGKFEALMADGSVKEVGPTLRGIIRYTYFEDYTIPPLDWTVNREVLLNDYQEKVLPDIIAGNITPNTMNY